MIQLSSSHPTFSMIVSVAHNEEQVPPEEPPKGSPSARLLETTIHHGHRIIRLQLVLESCATQASVSCAKMEAESFLYFLSTNNIAHVPVFQHPKFVSFWRQVESLYEPATE